jgi:Squalene-hopene cyclase C-terminal domain/Prenyltransferase and squalene oxidase repeat
MFSLAEQRAIEEIIQGRVLYRAQEWLIRTHVDNGTDYGWGVSVQGNEVTTWGGSLDGIRGLLACGVSRDDPLIRRTVDWMVSKQRDDGSFLSKSITWPCVEATAWVLLVLRQVGYNLESKQVIKAGEFLEKCIQNNGGLGTSDIDEVRIYPTALTLWALHGLSNKETNIAGFLLRSLDRNSGGWGNFPNSSANVAITAHVLYILLTTDHLQRDHEICKRAVNFILSQRNAQGVWNNFAERWYSKYQVEAVATPNWCGQQTITWVLLALLASGLDVLDDRIIKAFTWVVSNQSPNGSWTLSEEDNIEYIWCMADICVILNNIRLKLIKPILHTAFNSHIVRVEERPFQRIIHNFTEKYVSQENINTLLLTIILIIITHEVISSYIYKLLLFLQLQQGSILSNLIASFIWVILVTAFVAIVTSFRKKRSNKES